MNHDLEISNKIKRLQGKRGLGTVFTPTPLRLVQLHAPEGLLRQSCRQHWRVRRNAEIELVCLESYYDRVLLYAADHSGRRLPRHRALCSMCRTYIQRV